MSVTESTKPLPPGQSGLPFVGETLSFLRDPHFVHKRYQKYGPIFRTHILGRPTVVMSGEEAARFLLHEAFDHFSWSQGWPKNFHTLLGRSLFLMDGEEHKRNRKLITPVFHGRALQGYLLTMDEIIQKYIKKWEQEKQFAWFTEFKKMTFEVASTLLIGSRPGPENDHISELFTTLADGLFAPPINLPWTAFGRAVRARDELMAYVEEKVKERQKQVAEEVGDRPDALTLLVHSRDENGEQLDLEELKAEAILLLFAGHETTTSLLTSLCLHLAKHPPVLEKARQEQQMVNPSTPPTMEELRQMSYLDQIIKEVERIDPPVPGGFRGVVKPFDFQGYHIPAGWQVQYNIVRTHYDETVYTNPEQFDPGRFDPSQANHSPFSLIGFGGGSRLCIGKGFALLEIKLLLSHLLRHHQWQLVPGQDLTIVRIPTTRPKDDLLVQFAPL